MERNGMKTTTEAHVSIVAELIRQIAQDVGYDPSLVETAVAPDDRNIVYFDDDGGVAVRTRQHITKEGGTQGGTRLLLVKGGETPDVEAALAHSYDLSGVMTLKTGNIEAAIARALSDDQKINSWFKVPKTGGAKGVLAMRSDHHADKNMLEKHLRGFVRGHLDQLRSGDGIGPDMGVSPEMMNIMGDEAAKHLGEQYRRQFTNRGQFPGRDEATGRYAIAAMQILAKDVPVSKRTHVIQGMGSAGGHYARILQSECTQDGHRVVAIGDRQRGLVALDRNRGLVWGKDYIVDQTGTITWWNEDVAQSIGPEQVLYVPAGIKTLAAIGNVITPENYRRIIGDRASAGRTRVIIEIANMGIVPAAAKKMEKSTDVLIGAAPFVSAGGVLASLWERHEPLLESRLGRKIKYQDVADALMLLAACNAKVVMEFGAQEHIGLHTAAHRLGFRQQFVA
jgi:glutamate dehydrogenase/leucine dehydrogenase